MRLTGISDITARTIRTAGTSDREKVATPARVRAVQSDDGIGVATIFVNAEVSPSPTFDAERVAEIRKAIEEDRYPLVPARIADAMIAAKLYGVVTG